MPASALFLLLALYNVAATAQNTTLVSRQIARMQQLSTLQSAQWGFAMQPLGSNQPVVEHQSLSALTPASTLKLFTTGAALGLLGSNYMFETIISYDGVVSGAGVLQGNIYIQGSGDPSLGSDRIPGNPGREALLTGWVESLKKAGITSIAGNIIADDLLFSYDVPTPGGWPWIDLGNYYGSGAFGINLDENVYQLYFKPGSTGQPADILKTEPAVPGLTHRSLV